MSRGAVDGFDYVLQKPVQRSRDEWRSLMATHIKGGGRRRVENGETFIHEKGGRIVAEVYANLSHIPHSCDDSCDHS